MPSFISFPIPDYSPYASMFSSVPGMHQPSITPLVQPSPRTDPRDITILSSPPIDVDPVERLHKYFSWLIVRSPSQAEMFAKAKVAALKAGYTFATIFKLSNEK